MFYIVNKIIDMDAIQYWIDTLRAPCLYKYDQKSQRNFNDISQQPKPNNSLFSPEENLTISSPKKKKKKKMSILDSNSSSSSSQMNFIYFEKSSQAKNSKRAQTTFLSDAALSKAKSCLNVKNNKTPLVQESHSENSESIVCSSPEERIGKNKFKMVTSTPICSNHQQFNINTMVKNNGMKNELSKVENYKKDCKFTLRQPVNKTSKGTLQRGCQNKFINICADMEQSRNRVRNNTFEDCSDVSGFTANYIRSTKLMSGKSRNAAERTKLSKKLNGTALKNGTKEKSTLWMNKSHVLNDTNKRMTINSSGDSSHIISDLMTANLKDSKNICTRKNGTGYSHDTFIHNCNSNNNKLKTRCIQKKLENSHERKYMSSSSEDELFLAEKSKICSKNKCFYKKKSNGVVFNSRQHCCLSFPNIWSPDEKNVKVKEKMDLTFHSVKKSILGPNNCTDPIHSSASTNNGHHLPQPKDCTFKEWEENIILYDDKMKNSSTNILSKENSQLIKKNKSAVFLNGIGSKTSITACFSDSESDTPKEERKYFF